MDLSGVTNEVLRLLLAQNQLAITGTREQMIERLGTINVDAPTSRTRSSDSTDPAAKRPRTNTDSSPVAPNLPGDVEQPNKEGDLPSARNDEQDPPQAERLQRRDTELTTCEAQDGVRDRGVPPNPVSNPAALATLIATIVDEKLKNFASTNPSPVPQQPAHSVPQPPARQQLSDPAFVASLLSQSGSSNYGPSQSRMQPASSSIAAHVPQKTRQLILRDAPVPPTRTRCIARSLSNPSFPDESLTMQAAHYIFQSIASSTRRTYSSGERHFIRFCLFHKLISPQTPFLPTSESTLIHFVTHLSNTVSYGTIKVYLAAVKNLHVEFGCPLDFSSMPFLYKTLRGIKSSLGIAKRARFPITISILRQIYAKLKPFQSLDTDSSMLWAAFTLAFFGFLRSSEFTYNGKFNIQSHLTRSDVHFYPNIVQPVSFEVVIKKSKTDPFRETAKLTIAKSNSTVCAVTALRDYLLQTNPSGATQPLFQFSDGRHLTRSSLTNNLRALLKVCGLDSTCYASHSFRIGAATTAGAAGLPDWLIKVLGRWKSDAYQSYIRTPKETILQVPQNLASCLSS
ncbi:uncharacterized protein [Porites lutea]|uniref:uncharacterized protein n=1 Tax=Porites lutea TaxID=51062 RepID=UPI003CC5B43E